MDSPEQQSLELAKEGVKGLLAPVQDLVQRLLGPAATEVGLSLADSARVWRMRRALRLFEEVKVMVEAAGIEVKPVAPRLLFPILDAASLEDDDDLQRRWAALLANGATPDFEAEVLPSFPGVLKELTGFEVQFLDRVFDEAMEDEQVKRAYIKAGNPEFQHEPNVECTLRESTAASASPVMLGKLGRLGLLTLQRALPILINGNPLSNNRDRFLLSPFGKAFVRACRPPKAR